MSRALHGKNKVHGAVILKGSVQFVLIVGCGGPDTPLLGELNVPHVAALHDEVTHRWSGPQ